MLTVQPVIVRNVVLTLTSDEYDTIYSCLLNVKTTNVDPDTMNKLVEIAKEMPAPEDIVWPSDTPAVPVDSPLTNTTLIPSIPPSPSPRS